MPAQPNGTPPHELAGPPGPDPAYGGSSSMEFAGRFGGPPGAPRGGGGVRYYSPVSALQLPNGDIVPYDPDVLLPGLEHLSISPVPVRLLVPAYSPPVGYGGPYYGRGGGRRGKGGRGGAVEGADGRGGGGRGGGGGIKAGAKAGGGGRGGSRRSRTVQKQLQENIKKTVYISDIDQQVTEEELANFFAESGGVVDCRVCGDPNSAKRFAFIEFVDEDAAKRALERSGSVVGSSAIRVLPSKTAIVPVNKEFMPKTMEEMDQCSRTVYVANIDKKVDKHDVKRFFESLCGKVNKLRLLGDYAHSTRIAFVEFGAAESALAALNCSGAVLGTLPVRVSPSKAPVRLCSGENEAE
eukprot:evm.model.scf_122.17 EVM.evm.TU.scf_122.17   scf_122:132537-133595(+)